MTRWLVLAVAIGSPLLPGCGGSSSSSAKQQTQEDITAGAIRAVEDALDGKSVKAEDYRTTKDKIFVVFNARIAQITEQMGRNPTANGLAAAKTDSQRLLRAMERLDPNRADTIEFRKSCKEVGFLD